MNRRQRQAEKRDVAYQVSYWPRVAQDVAAWGLDNDEFIPTLEELVAELETNPKQFPVKRDELAGARAADIKFRGDTWRAIFDVDDDYGEVFILALGPHDKAYRDAERRRR